MSFFSIHSQSSVPIFHKGFQDLFVNVTKWTTCLIQYQDSRLRDFLCWFYLHGKCHFLMWNNFFDNVLVTIQNFLLSLIFASLKHFLNILQKEQSIYFFAKFNYYHFPQFYFLKKKFQVLIFLRHPLDFCLTQFLIALFYCCFEWHNLFFCTFLR